MKIYKTIKVNKYHTEISGIHVILLIFLGLFAVGYTTELGEEPNTYLLSDISTVPRGQCIYFMGQGNLITTLTIEDGQTYIECRYGEIEMQVYDGYLAGLHMASTDLTFGEVAIQGWLLVALLPSQSIGIMPSVWPMSEVTDGSISWSGEGWCYPRGVITGGPHMYYSEYPTAFSVPAESDISWTGNGYQFNLSTVIDLEGFGVQTVDISAIGTVYIVPETAAIMIFITGIVFMWIRYRQ